MQVERKLCFPKNRKLKIMQVSDPQDMHIVRSAMLKMLDKAYDTVKPDIVVFTGDNILGNHLDDYILGNKKHNNPKLTKKRMRKALRYVLKPVNDRKIPFCMIFGNHDDMNRFSKQEQADLYKEYEYFFGLNSEDNGLECGTYNVPIYDEKGENVIYNLWLIDSAGADSEGKSEYSYVKDEAVEWYRNKSDELKRSNNGNPVMSLMFQHIPVPETTEFFKECDKETKGCIEHNDKYYVLDSEKASGFAFEYPCVCEKNVNQIQTIAKQGDVCAIVFGHDHINSFTGNLHGVNVVQTSGASFRSYGNMISRGVRVFEIDSKDTSSFETYNVTYFDLFGKKFKSFVRYIMSADEMEGRRNLIWGIGAAVVVLFIVYLIMFNYLNGLL